MKPNFVATDPSKSLMVIRDSTRLTFGSLNQRSNQHRHLGPFWNSAQFAYESWVKVGLETGLHPLFFNPIFCKDHDINPLLQFNGCSVPLKDNHLNLAIEALNHWPAEISYHSRAVHQWVVFWLDYCIKELENPAAFIL